MMQRKPAMRCFDEKLGGFYSDSSAFRFRVHIDPPQATPRVNCLRNHKPLLQDVSVKSPTHKAQTVSQTWIILFSSHGFRKTQMTKRAATVFSFFICRVWPNRTAACR